MTNPNGRSNPEPAPMPSWPMVTRPQEMILQEVWRLERLGKGGSWKSYKELGKVAGVKLRQAGNLVRDLIDKGWLKPRPFVRGETRMLTVRAPKLGDCYDGQNVAYGGRQNVAYRIGKTLPTKKNSIPNEVLLGGNAPLFDPPSRVNVWEASKRLGQPTLCHTVAELIKSKEVQKVRRDGRLRRIASATVLGQMHGLRCALFLPTPEGTRADRWEVAEGDLSKLEFYP